MSCLGEDDEQNLPTEAIADINRQDLTMNADAVANILITADGRVAATAPAHDSAADRRCIAEFRARVDQILAE